MARTRAVDINRDGVVDLGDLSVVTNDWGRTGPAGSLPGDINGDGFVDLQDQSIITNNWQQHVQYAPSRRWWPMTGTRH